jgi:hypothetical protein
MNPRTSNRKTPKKQVRTSSRLSNKANRKSPAKNTTKNAVAKMISTLFHSRTQAHILHLQTESFAGHKALNAYYDGIVPLVDKYAESYQGIYGIIKGYQGMPQIVQGDNAVIPYFEKLEKDIKGMRPKLPKDLDLENAYADILDLIHSTLYLLKHLH